VGVIVILTVLAIIVRTSIDAGLPAIKSGELPLWTFEVTTVLFFLDMACSKSCSLVCILHIWSATI